MSTKIEKQTNIRVVYTAYPTANQPHSIQTRQYSQSVAQRVKSLASPGSQELLYYFNAFDIKAGFIFINLHCT